MASTENRKIDRPDALLMTYLRRKYGVSKRYINMSIDGTRESETSTQIKKDYDKVLTVVKKAIANL